MRRIISFVVLVALLFSNISFAVETQPANAPVAASHLSPNLILDDIGDNTTHDKTMALAEIQLQMCLREISVKHPASGVINRGTLESYFTEIDRMLIAVEESVHSNRARIELFHKQLERIVPNNNIFSIPAIVWRNEVPHKYVLLFSMTGKDGIFPIVPCPREEYNAKKEAIKRQVIAGKLPQQNSEATTAIDDYIEQQAYDREVIAWAHAQGLARSAQSLGIDYKLIMRTIAHWSRLTIEPSSNSIEERKCYIVTFNPGSDIERRLLKHQVTVRAANERVEKVSAYAHSSNGAIHLFIPQEIFNVFQKQFASMKQDEHKILALGHGTGSDYEELLFVMSCFANELGAMLRAPVTEFRHANLGFESVNEVRKRFEQAFQALRLGNDNYPLPKSYTVADLDVLRSTVDGVTIRRDYASGKLAEQLFAIPPQLAACTYSQIKDAVARENCIIGVPKEIKPNAERVGLTPNGVRFLTSYGIKVIVEKGAGRHHFSDAEYKEAGAELVNTAEEVWSRATIIKKVKEPLESEFRYLRQGLTVFTYLHLSSPELKRLAEELVNKQVTGIAYETIVTTDTAGRKITPALKPMSIIAGNLGGYYGALYSLYSAITDIGGQGRKVKLAPAGEDAIRRIKNEYPVVAGFDGILKDKVREAVILGGGVSGECMARQLLKAGAKVTIADISDSRLKELKSIFVEYGDALTLINPGIDINKPTETLLRKYESADILGGCILLPGRKAPQMSRELLENISTRTPSNKNSKPKIIIDIALDQGGNFYGSRSMSYDNPVFVDEFGNTRFCVPNMPDAVGRGASIELEKTTVAYTLALAMGLKTALDIFPELQDGINTYLGKVANSEVAKTYPNMPISRELTYKRFKTAIVDYVNGHDVDPYSPTIGTPDLAELFATMINENNLQHSKFKVIPDDIMISVGSAGVLDLLARIFCNIENITMKEEEDRDVMALSPAARALYPQSDFAQVTGLDTKKKARIKVIDSEDIIPDSLEELMAKSFTDKAVLVFLDNEDTAVLRERITAVYNLLKKYPKYRDNVVIINDISRRFELPLYNLAGVITFNEAIRRAFATTASGSIAAPSTNVQAGLSQLIKERHGSKTDEYDSRDCLGLVDRSAGIISEQCIQIEPDPTVSVNPFTMLKKSGAIPGILTNVGYSHMRTLYAVLTPNTAEINKGDPNNYVKEVQEKTLRTDPNLFQKAYRKAQAHGIIARLSEADSQYTAELLQRLHAGQISDVEFSNLFLCEPNPRIVAILKEAGTMETIPDGVKFSIEEIVRFMVIFNIKKMHVGAPGYPRNEFAKEALKPVEIYSITDLEKLNGLKMRAREACAFFATEVFGLKGITEANITNPAYGSKVALQDLLMALSRKSNKPIEIAVPAPYYVGYRTTIEGIGISKRNSRYFPSNTGTSWIPTVSEIDSSFSHGTDTRKVLLLTGPDNPSGTVIPREAIKEYLKYAALNDVFVIFDAAYARLVFEGEKPVNIGKIIDELAEELPTIDSSAKDVKTSLAVLFTQSKEILHPGSRLGGVICYDTSLVEMINKDMKLGADPIAIQGQVMVYGRSAAKAAEEFIAEHNRHLKRNKDYVCRTLEELNIDYVEPKRAFYILFRIGEGYIRFSYAGPFADIVQTMERIKAFYQSDRKNISTADGMFKVLGITALDGDKFGAFSTRDDEKAYVIRSEEVHRLKIMSYLLQKDIIGMIHKAESGHPGGSLSMIDIATVLYNKIMRIDPTNPGWENRDRFVLSKGHAAPALYAALAGREYFPRKWLGTLRAFGTRLEGHPSMNKTPGVDMSSGALGTGFSAAVGIAINAKMDNRDYKTYCMLGDGELQEGIVSEAAEYAAAMKLDNLIAFVDANGMEIDGKIEGVNVTDQVAKWRAIGWHVIEIDGHDIDAIIDATNEARNTKGKPVLIYAHTEKGRFLPYMDAHGKAPNIEEMNAAFKVIDERLAMLAGKNFDANKFMEETDMRLAADIAKNKGKIDADNRERSEEAQRRLAEIASKVSVPSREYGAGKEVATRVGFGESLVELGKKHQDLKGASADLGGSINYGPFEKAFGLFSADNPLGMYLRFPISEQAMVGVGLGLASCGKVLACSTYGMFVLRQVDQINSVLYTGLPLIVVGAHAGTFTGPDGPSHMDTASVGVLAQLPGINIYESADAEEQRVLSELVYDNAKADGGVHYIHLTRPNTPVINKPEGWQEGVKEGFYAIYDNTKGADADVVIVSTGPIITNIVGPIAKSIISAAEKLAAEGKKLKVINITRITELKDNRTKINQFFNIIKRAKLVVTIMDGQPHILEDVVNRAITRNIEDADRSLRKVVALGVPGFPGSARDHKPLHVKYGIDAEGIVKTVAESLRVSDEASSETGLSDWVRDLIRKTLKIINQVFGGVGIKSGMLAQAVNETTETTTNIPSDFTQDDKAGFIFSPVLTFGDKSKGDQAEGIGPLLPQLANAGINVAVLLSSDSAKRAEQERLIAELNSSENIRNPQQRIRCGAGLEEIRAQFGDLKKDGPARFCYLKTTAEKEIDGVLYVVNLAARKILAILGRICGLDSAAIEQAFEAMRLFAQAA